MGSDKVRANLPIREATTGRDSAEPFKRETVQNLRHVDVYGIEAGSLERECHLGVAIDTLFSQNGDWSKTRRVSF